MTRWSAIEIWRWVHLLFIFMQLYWGMFCDRVLNSSSIAQENIHCATNFFRFLKFSKYWRVIIVIIVFINNIRPNKAKGNWLLIFLKIYVNVCKVQTLCKTLTFSLWFYSIVSDLIRFDLYKLSVEIAKKPCHSSNNFYEFTTNV